MSQPPSPQLITCPQCNNRVDAANTFCPHCRAQLRSAPPPPDLPTRIMATLDRLADRLFGAQEPPVAPVPAAGPPLYQMAAGPPPPTEVLGGRRALPPPRAVGDLIDGRYRVTQVATQADCTYYGAQDAGGSSYRYLLRETAGPPPIDLARWPQLPGLCVPLEAFADGARQLLVLQSPEKAWQPVDAVQPPLEVGQALEWTLQIGHALRQLVPHFGPPPPWEQFRQGIIVAGQARISDLSVLDSAGAQGSRPEQAALAALLDWLRYAALLAAGPPPQPGTPDAAVLLIMQQARAGRYPTLPDMLRALQQSLSPPQPAAAPPTAARRLRQSSGAATDAGRTREHNEDSIAKFDYIIDQSGSAAQVGLYIVADGIGGYAGGEIASQQTAVQAFRVFVEQQFMPRLKKETQKLEVASRQSPHARLLSDLVQEANAIVYRSNQAGQTEHGSTITAALVIGDRAHIANVGDSRTYLLRDGRLAQVTEDHSLVYRLYRAGQITRDEIYTHPQKNIVIRSLGEKASVEVDVAEHTLRRGDRLLLCSDGLWEMVRDDELTALLLASPDPYGACDRLVDAANRNGGLDNISAIVVDLL